MNNTLNTLPSYFQKGDFEVLRRAAPELLDIITNIMMFEFFDQELIRKLNREVPRYMLCVAPESNWSVIVPDQMERFIETHGVVVFIIQVTPTGESIYYPFEIRPASFC